MEEEIYSKCGTITCLDYFLCSHYLMGFFFSLPPFYLIRIYSFGLPALLSLIFLLGSSHFSLHPHSFFVTYLLWCAIYKACPPVLITDTSWSLSGVLQYLFCVCGSVDTVLTTARTSKDCHASTHTHALKKNFLLKRDYF